MRKILIEAEGYSSVLFDIDSLQSDTIRLVPRHDLPEFTVTDRNLQYQIYPITRAMMANYPNVFASLNEIPFINVLPGGQIFLSGSPNIKLLLNGVDTTPTELSLLSKDDIWQVKVCNQPPMRYMAEGITGVINIITKSELRGGNIGINADQAFNPIKGENSAGMFYNHHRSRYSVQYSNTNSHFCRARYSQVLDYDFDGENYHKDKEGLDSPQRTDNNSLTLSYQNYNPYDYLYHVSAGGTINAVKNDNRQRVNSRQFAKPIEAQSLFHARYLRPFVRNYFEKTFHDGEMRIMTNMRYQHQRTDYLSAYSEGNTQNFGDIYLDSYSKYRITDNAIFGEAQFEYYPGKWVLYADTYGRRQWSSYTDLQTSIGERSSFWGASVSALTQARNFVFRTGMGVSGHFVHSTLAGANRSIWAPMPRLAITFTGLRGGYFSLEYTYNTRGPRISELSETPYWLDTKLVYHGNSGLRPYRLHNVDFMGNYRTKYADFGLRAHYNSAPGMICNHYIRTDDYILETLLNLDSYNEIYGQLDISVRPLGTSKLEYYTRVIGARLHGRGVSYRWNGYRFQWMNSLTFRTSHWTIEAYYQYPGKVAEGQLILPRGEAWSLGVSYRPYDGLSVGATIFRPFGGPFHEREKTVGSALVSNEYIRDVADWANTVSITLSWNLSFGKNKNSRGPLLDNYINDEGYTKK